MQYHLPRRTLCEIETNFKNKKKCSVPSLSDAKEYRQARNVLTKKRLSWTVSNRVWCECNKATERQLRDCRLLKGETGRLFGFLSLPLALSYSRSLTGASHAPAPCKHYPGWSLFLQLREKQYPTQGAILLEKESLYLRCEEKERQERGAPISGNFNGNSCLRHLKSYWHLKRTRCLEYYRRPTLLTSFIEKNACLCLQTTLTPPIRLKNLLND